MPISTPSLRNSARDAAPVQNITTRSSACSTLSGARLRASTISSRAGVPLAICAAKRARQINSYFTQLNEGLLQNIGPLVEYQNNEKPLSIAFREIDEGLLEETLGEDDANEGN